MDYCIPGFFHHGTMDILAMPEMDKTSFVLARLDILGGLILCCGELFCAV